jgi:arginyl-tRNA synthetase
VGTLHADRILYVTGSPQALHFAQVFAVARKAGFAPDDVQLEHIGFGSMLGPDGKPFKTRAGGTVKLMDLLDEAQKRAFELVTGKNAADVAAGRANELDEQQRREVARAVGIGAVKYADLSQNRTSDYVFSFEKMLALDGNTAPYMQYTYARVMSIFRKAGLAVESVQASPIQLEHPQERALGLKLLQFSEVIDSVAANCQPNLLCAYLYDLARSFTGFYEACPVLDSPEPVRSSRLALSAGAARVIRTGLDLLGIQTVEQM